MSLEHRLYQSNRIGWVMFLMFKYFRTHPMAKEIDPRFKPVMDAVRAVATDEEKKAAREAYEDWTKGVFK